MNPSEAWNLLTVRSISMGERQSSDHEALRSADVASLLAGLDSEAFLMGMAAECGDFDSLRKIELILWTRANTIADREGWDPPRGAFTVRRMVALALYEAVDDKRCYVCNGSGSMEVSLETHPGFIMAPSFKEVSDFSGSIVSASIRCPACQGAGRIKLSGRKKADLAGINKDTWTRLWAKRYEPVFEIARNWRESASNYLATRIRRAESDKVDKAPELPRMEDFTIHAHKVMKMKDYCARVKNRVRIAPRQATPAGNAALNFEALNRPTLTVSR